MRIQGCRRRLAEVIEKYYILLTTFLYLAFVLLFGSVVHPSLATMYSKYFLNTDDTD